MYARQKYNSIANMWWVCDKVLLESVEIILLKTWLKFLSNHPLKFLIESAIMLRARFPLLSFVSPLFCRSLLLSSAAGKLCVFSVPVNGLRSVAPVEFCDAWGRSLLLNRMGHQWCCSYLRLLRWSRTCWVADLLLSPSLRIWRWV